MVFETLNKCCCFLGKNNWELGDRDLFILMSSWHVQNKKQYRKPTHSLMEMAS